jgi:hypothetical protein
MSVRVRIAVLAATLSAAVTMWVPATPALAEEEVTKPGETVHLKGELKNFIVEGSLTDKKAGQTVTIPEGSTINLKDDIEIEENAAKKRFEGTIEGFLKVPPFTTVLTLPVLGTPTPVTMGVTITQSGPSVLKLHEAPESACLPTERFRAGCVTLKGSASTIVGFQVVGILGIRVPIHCETSKPVVLPLETTRTFVETILTGPSFKGTTTMPSIKCPGLQGIVLGLVLTTALSGPENPFTLAIHPPPLPPEE